LRSYCIFEWCVAAMAGKSIITVAEVDPRYGGAHIDSFQFHPLFKHILNHEVIEINRSYWDAFTTKVHERIGNTINSQTIECCSVGEWNSQKITKGIEIHSDKVTVVCKTDKYWQVAVGTNELQGGRKSFSVEVVNEGRSKIGKSIVIGAVPVRFVVTKKILGPERNGISSWAYSRGGSVYRGQWDAYAGRTTYGTGDVITVELDFVRETVTFFKNGVSLGVAFTNLKSAVYPAVSIHGMGTSVRLLDVKTKTSMRYFLTKTLM